MPVWKQPITIVTGLPRSGTSMMMKMLEAGGVPVLCDGVRSADVDNPNGYYEFEPVKHTRDDPRWIDEARGKAVKMVYSLVYDLPVDHRYNIVFMRRDLDEILASQRRMLDHLGHAADGIENCRMKRLFEGELRRFEGWLATAQHIRSVEVRYRDIVDGTVAPLRRINALLGSGLDTDAMANTVDTSLYRNRKQPTVV